MLWIFTVPSAVGLKPRLRAAIVLLLFPFLLIFSPSPLQAILQSSWSSGQG